MFAWGVFWAVAIGIGILVGLPTGEALLGAGAGLVMAFFGAASAGRFAARS